MKLNFKLWKDMLTERVGSEKIYSQGRVYLLWSVAAYYITLGFITVKGLRPDMSISMEPLKVIIDALQWAMMLFAGYVFGGKGLEVIKAIMAKGSSAQAPTQSPPTKAPNQPSDTSSDGPDV
jgi:hypothetical protein